MAVEAQQMKSLHSDSMMSFRGMDLADSIQRGGGGGGGRRKQSKPIRVFMDMVSGGAADAIDSRPPETLDAMPELTDPKSSPSRALEMMDVEEEMFSCDLCSDSFMTQSALTDHIQQSHDLNGRDGNTDIAYPTKYHQLGQEFQQEIGLPNDNDEETKTPVPTSRPTEVVTPITPNADSNGNGPSPDMYQNINSEGEIINRNYGENGKARIFHKDAFCKMCDREFCNKYFLKTHMANKHGIYESGSPPSSSSPKMFGSNGDVPNPPTGPSFAETLAMLPSVTGSGAFSAFGPPLPMPSLAESAKTSTQAPPPPLLPPSMPSLATSSSNSSQKYPLPMLPSLAPKQQRQSPNLPSTKPNSSSSSSSSSSSKPTSKDMEDYCEICQKHFCNKYYLKKHKQDVHGIIPEPSTGNSGKRRSNNSSSNNSSSAPAVSSSNSSPLSDVMSNAPLGGHLPPGLDGMPPGLSNVMFINPFAPPFALQSASVLQQAAAAAGFPPGLPLPTPPPPPVSQPSPINSTSPGSLPPTSNASANTNGEQRNPEAYCDLCRKEFCNIHFLKIHKANKHGVFYEDLPHIIQQASLSQLPVLNVPSLPPTSSHSEPSPPGGVIQIAPTAQESGVKVKAEKQDGARAENDRPLDLFPSSSPGSVKGEPCGVCKKEFNNKYSLQIHMINAHNMKPADLDMALGLGAEPKSEHLLQGTMFSNMIAAKLADRVMCDICNKEVCNKYFLKTHKLKVHGIDTSNCNSSNNSEREMESPPRTKSSSVIKSSPPGAPRPPSTEPSTVKMPTTPTKPEPSPQPLPPRPNDEELLKMGIDPEAYCEICKKEFCSKYFLKTHRANIHGIKSSSSGSQSPEKNDMKPIFSSNHKPSQPNQSFPLHGFPPLDAKDLPGFPGLPGLPGLPVSLAQSLNSLGAGGGPLSLPPLPSQAAGGMLPGFPPENWPWKDQLINQRVRCDICNKDVANRYFLKTHMINKHGLNYDPLTGTTTPLPPSSQPNEHASGATDMQPENLSMKANEERKDLMDGGEEARISAKTWHVPPNGEKTSEHVVNNNNNKENMPSSSGATKIDGSGGKCVLCGLMFAETVALQLHMIQDHQGQVTVTPEGTGTSATQLITFNLKKKYQRSMKKKRLRRFGPSVGGAIGEKVRSAIVNHIASHQKGKKKFRCAHCQERFLSRVQCQTHIRQMHPGVRSGSSERSKQNSAVTSTPMDTSDETTPAVMQSFSLQEQDAGPKRRVARSVVQLPVFGKISEPVSVTFTLTPV